MTRKTWTLIRGDHVHRFDYYFVCIDVLEQIAIYFINFLAEYCGFIYFCDLAKTDVFILVI